MCPRRYQDALSDKWVGVDLLGVDLLFKFLDIHSHRLLFACHSRETCCINPNIDNRLELLSSHGSGLTTADTLDLM
eukprot:scaffold430484_cov17-Prasinocladus_malaysianus.AAC.1